MRIEEVNDYLQSLGEYEPFNCNPENAKCIKEHHQGHLYFKTAQKERNAYLISDDKLVFFQEDIEGYLFCQHIKTQDARLLIAISEEEFKDIVGHQDQKLLVSGEMVRKLLVINHDLKGDIKTFMNATNVLMKTMDFSNNPMKSASMVAKMVSKPEQFKELLDPISRIYQKHQ